MISIALQAAFRPASPVSGQSFSTLSKTAARKICVFFPVPKSCVPSFH
jgi:hypothetical protein